MKSKNKVEIILLIAITYYIISLIFFKFPIRINIIIVFMVFVFWYGIILIESYWKSLHFKVYKNIKNKYCECFEQRNLLNEREIKLYKLLYNILHEDYWDRFIIFSQVRMRDVVDLKKNLSYTKRKLYKPHYWSIDFLIVDSKNNFKPIIAIELSWWEWSNHADEYQIEQDQKKKDLINICDIQYKMFENWDENRKEYVTKTILSIMKELEF